MRRCTVATLATALVAASIISCDKTPTRPSPAQEATPDPTIQSIRIDGPAGLTPGGTAQYTVIGQFSNGSTRDVTATSTLRSSDSDVLAIAAGGRAMASKPGQVVVAAENSGRRAGIDVLVLAPGTFRVTGTVSEAGMPVADAAVDVLDGGVRAAMSTRSDDSGTYRLFGVAGDIEIRASKAGYITQVNRLMVSGNTTSDFGLTLDQRFSVDGTYSLTLTASTRCSVSGSGSLPPELRTRNYTARLHQIGARLEVELSDAPLLKGSFAGELHGTRVTFDIRGVDTSLFYYYFYDLEPNSDVLEAISPTDIFETVGRVDATVSQAGISGTLKGLLGLISAQPFRRLTASCRADNHTFMMVRR